jgi:hypothetical protein
MGIWKKNIRSYQMCIYKKVQNNPKALNPDPEEAYDVRRKKIIQKMIHGQPFCTSALRACRS